MRVLPLTSNRGAAVSIPAGRETRAGAFGSVPRRDAS